MPSYAEKRAEFSANKKALSPILKLETNIPCQIVMVKKIDSTVESSTSDNSQYANLKFIVDVEIDGEISTKEWNVSSEALAETLEDKGVDVGSSFVVTKTGEGFQTKYKVEGVVNKPLGGNPTSPGPSTLNNPQA